MDGNQASKHESNCWRKCFVSPFVHKFQAELPKRWAIRGVPWHHCFVLQFLEVQQCWSLGSSGRCVRPKRKEIGHHYQEKTRENLGCFRYSRRNWWWRKYSAFTDKTNLPANNGRTWSEICCLWSVSSTEIEVHFVYNMKPTERRSAHKKFEHYWYNCLWRSLSILLDLGIFIFFQKLIIDAETFQSVKSLFKNTYVEK